MSQCVMSPGHHLVTRTSSCHDLLTKHPLKRKQVAIYLVKWRVYCECSQVHNNDIKKIV